MVWNPYWYFNGTNHHTKGIMNQKENNPDQINVRFSKNDSGIIKIIK